jgi:hypothetical protein
MRHQSEASSQPLPAKKEYELNFLLTLQADDHCTEFHIVKTAFILPYTGACTEKIYFHFNKHTRTSLLCEGLYTAHAAVNSEFLCDIRK